MGARWCSLFFLSIWTPEPFRYLLWAIAIAGESGAMLAEDRDAAQRVRRDRDLSALAPALWWLYFDSVADISMRVLELSGGSPTMARAIFAVGHMLPAFSLLVPAAGVGLLLEEDPPRIAYWLACVGVGIYLLGTRAFLAGTIRVPAVVRTLLLVATFSLGRLHTALSPHAYLWLLTAWVVMCAVLTTRTSGRVEDADIERYISGRAGRAPEVP